MGELVPQHPIRLPPKPRAIHDLTGSPGYPVAMIAMNYEYRELLVHHWRKDLTVGDLVVVGTNTITARTYLVTRNEPNPDRSNLHRRSDGWMAVLIAVRKTVTVAGQTYCCGDGAK